MKNKVKFPVQQGKKSFKKAVLEHLAETQKDVLSIKKDVRGIIGEEVKKYTDSYMSEVTHIKKEYSIWRKLLIEKGILTRGEINEELKK